MDHRVAKKLKYLGLGALVLFILSLVFASRWLHLDAMVRLLAEKRQAKDKKEAHMSLLEVVLLAEGDIASRFVKTVILPLKGAKIPHSVIYGNKDFGYFETRDFTFTPAGDIAVRVIPPSYQSPLSFCFQSFQGQTVFVKEKSDFVRPDSLMFDEIKVEIEGEIQQPFILLAGVFLPAFSQDQSEGSYFPLIINKFGEIVWAHLPQNGKRTFQKYATIKPLGPGEYGILFGEKWSFFERFNYRGEVLSFVDPKEAIDPYVMHHDFVYLPEDKLLTLGHKVHYLRNLLPLKNPLFSSLGYLAPPISLVSTTVEEVDIKTNSHKVLWDPLETFNFFDLGWARNLADAKRSVESLPRHFGEFGGDDVHVDFSHANSIERTPHGYLVSLRNLSKLVLLDQTATKVMATMGNDETDSVQTLDEDHAFYHQHHAQMLSSGHLLMMDNHTSPPAKKAIGGRVAVYGFSPDSKTMALIWNFYPPEAIALHNRGSAYLLRNQHVLAFYPASRDNIDHIFEVHHESGEILGHMSVYFAKIKRNFSDKQLRQLKEKGIDVKREMRMGGGNRAVPLYTLGTERVLDQEAACQREG